MRWALSVNHNPSPQRANRNADSCATRCRAYSGTWQPDEGSGVASRPLYASRTWSEPTRSAIVVQPGDAASPKEPPMNMTPRERFIQAARRLGANHHTGSVDAEELRGELRMEKEEFYRVVRECHVHGDLDP